MRRPRMKPWIPGLVARYGIESLRYARRAVRVVVGFTLLGVGVAMIVLPGPAFIVIPIALAILAGEFVWARVMMKRLRQHLDRLRAEVGGSAPPEGGKQ